MKNKDGKIRILFVAPFPPPIHGASAMSQIIKDSKLINNEYDCFYVTNSSANSLTNIGKFSIVKVWSLIKSFATIFWILLTKRVSLCYLAITCGGPGFLKDAPFVLLCKLFCRKIVIHQHNKGMANYVNKLPYKWLLPMVYKNAKVILLSWHLYPDIEKIVPKENVMICPNGIKVDDSMSVEARKYENRVPHLLFLSNLLESKGVFVLLDALKILANKGLTFYCDFVGGETKEIDSDKFTLEVSHRDLGRCVMYHGRKYGKEKEQFFIDADIFVFPTYKEAFGLVNLEAMQYQLPIVTTNEGGIPDVVQDGVNGVICERNNAESLAVAIERLLLNPELRRQMGQNGLEILNQKFTLDKFESNLCQCLFKATEC